MTCATHRSKYFNVSVRELSTEFFLCFLLKAEKKKLELAEKYKRLKSSGKLEKYLKRKGKKMASKERKKMPHRRGLET